MIVSLGGYKDIAMFAPIKDVKISKYNEIDGLTADLEEVHLNNKTVKINFAILGSIDNYRKFIRKISDKSYHDFTFSDLGITERLRYINENKIDTTEKFTNVTVEFADDFPVKQGVESQEIGGTPVIAPINPNIVPRQNMDIDDVNLSVYGIRIIGSNINEIHKNAKAKQHLTQSNAIMDSVKYADNNVTFEGKEVTLNLLMRANNLNTFWNNYRAFQRAISTPKQKTLYVVDADSYFYFFYKSCTVKEFTVTPKIWFEFSLKLQIMSYVLEDDFLLVTEEDEPVKTEDDINTIKVKYL